MSSAATAGPPFRLPPGTGGGPAGGRRAMNGPSNGNDGPVRGSHRVFAHIDDLRAARPDVNIHSPIRSLLLQCEIHAKQAQTHLAFGRPDLALAEYIKATILCVEIIPRHKDYPALKSDRGDLHRLFGGLQKGITAQYQKFEEVKTIIQENNARNGVKPTLKSENEPSSTSNESISNIIQNQSTNVHAPIEIDRPIRVIGTLQSKGIHSMLNGAVNPPLAQPGNGDIPNRRQKPPVQPKPDALHGKSIKPTVGRPAPLGLSGTEEDLAARFARLRGPDAHISGVVQDPRIRTQTIGIPALVNSNKVPLSPPSTSSAHTNHHQQRPSGPRDMPQSGPLRPPKVPLDVDIPSMPRPPDAIYSPARNFDSQTNIDIPRATPRSGSDVMGRSNITSSGSNAGLISKSGLGNLVNAPGFDSRQDYFSRPSSLSNDARSKTSSKTTLPESTTITAEKLVEYLKRGSHDLRVLLVDIRPREEFDGGHIMSQSIICIEPMVLRMGVSAEDLADSLVLSPENEQILFKQRDSFDLVIYYDENSSDLRADVNNYGHETALADFSKAVYDYGYEKRLKQRPILLVGGLDSWVDLLGRGALKTSNTATGPPRKVRKTYGQLPYSKRTPAIRRPTYESRPLTKEEEQKWEQTVRDESFQDGATSGSPGVFREGQVDEAYFVRTTEDFVRRFPEASAIPESMISPQQIIDQSAHITAARIDELNSMMPRIPARPPPALPRPSYTGVSDRDSGVVTAVYKKLPAKNDHGIPAPATITRPVGYSNHCGLVNYGNTCYMNSVLQALSSTIPVATWLLRYDFLTAEKPPRKDNETSDPPQLMAKNLANLLRHLWSQKWSYVSPETLRNYILAVAKVSGSGTSAEGMGGNDQQDANEFLSFLLEILEDETNMMRDLPVITTSRAQIDRLWTLSPLEGSISEWNKHISRHDSEISRLFYHQRMTVYRCTSVTPYQCKQGQRRFEVDKFFFVDVPYVDGTTSLENCITQTFASEKLDGYACDACLSKDTTFREIKLSVRPEILVIVLNRYAKGDVKSPHIVTFGQELDMSPFVYDESVPDANGESPSSNLQSPNTGPLRYTCVAVIQHRGKTLSYGHYWTIARDQVSKKAGAAQWYKFEDKIVSEIDWKATQSMRSYVLIFQRKHT